MESVLGDMRWKVGLKSIQMARVTRSQRKYRRLAGGFRR